MKKKDKIYDSPEYKQIREHLPEILKEMERDKGLKQYQMPEGWNEDFERIYQAEHRKERIRNRILAGACAAIILGIGAVHVGERLELTSMVQADDIGKTTENGFEDGEYQYSTYGNVEEDEEYVISEDENDLNFTCKSLDELYTQVKQETKAPIFIIKDITEPYTVENAFYSKLHRNFTYRIELKDTGEYLYVNEQMQVDETGNGTVNEHKETTIYLKNLEMETDIYRSARDDSLKCNIMYNNKTLVVVSNLPVEKFENIISDIEYH